MEVLSPWEEVESSWARDWEELKVSAARFWEDVEGLWTRRADDLYKRQSQRRQAYEQLRQMREQLVHAHHVLRCQQGVLDLEDAEQEFQQLLTALNACIDQVLRGDVVDLDVLLAGLPFRITINSQQGSTFIWDEISEEYQQARDEAVFEHIRPDLSLVRAWRARLALARQHLWPRIRLAALRHRLRLRRPVSTLRRNLKNSGIVTLIHAQHAPPATSTALITDRLEVAAA